MPSPVGHSILGLTVGWGGPDTSGKLGPALYGLLVFASLAPDLDFLPGLLRGAPNLYHPSVSHSLAAAGVFGGVAAAVTLATRGPWRRVGWLAGLAYASHLLLDLASGDPRSNPGIALLWPLSGARVRLPWHVFPSIVHGREDQALAAALPELLSWQNLSTVGVEVLLLLPLALAVRWWGRRRR